MVVAFVYFIIIIYIFYFISKASAGNNLFSEKVLSSYFSNFQKTFVTSGMTLYRGDKSGENFLIAVKYSNTPISRLNLSTIYEVAEKNHIHSKILLTNETISPSSPLNKLLRVYEIQVLNSFEFKKLLDGNETDSILNTSDTSDDVCDISESNDPIQNGAFNTHGIFSIFKDKPDRL